MSEKEYQTPANNVGDEAELESLRQETATLREQLERTGADARKADQLEARIDSLASRNTKLMETLKEARQQLLALREEVDRLGQPPSGYGVLMHVYDDNTLDVFTSGRKMRLTCAPDIQIADFKQGQTVRLNEALTVVEACDFEGAGELCTLREVLDNGTRALVVAHADQERVVRLAEPLIAIEQWSDNDSSDDRPAKLRPGDTLLIDTKSGYAFERIPKAEVEDLVLEEVPDISYNDIGGLSRQIEQIHDAVELPFLHKDLYREYQLQPPKGVLLYGPPGCGKTLIAKAVANSLAKKMAALRGNDTHDAHEVKSYFLNIKGPELLNKFVGETERHIRLIFQRAREKASDGTPVIVFFDEMDSIFRTRGTGVSSDVETTIVPQLLSEIDGVEGLENVIVIGASNREDMIDPAILRPGRLDVKIKVERPDAEAAQDIFSKYLTDELPVHSDELGEFDGDRETCIKVMIEKVVDRMYAEIDENRFLEVTYAGGDKEVMYFKDFNSGAMTKNIVDRAKKYAVKSVIETGQRGLRIQHLMDAIVDEFAENEDLPNTTNPDDWARISGKKGERIVYIRTLIKGHKQTGNGRAIDTESNMGQYL